MSAPHTAVLAERVDVVVCFDALCCSFAAHVVSGEVRPAASSRQELRLKRFSSQMTSQNNNDTCANLKGRKLNRGLGKDVRIVPEYYETLPPHMRRHAAAFLASRTRTEKKNVEAATTTDFPTSAFDGAVIGAATALPLTAASKSVANEAVTELLVDGGVTAVSSASTSTATHTRERPGHRSPSGR
jgi:hypothetical protein